MKLVATLIISLFIGACSGHTSSTTVAQCGNAGAADDGCINDQDALKVVSLKSRRWGGAYCGDRIKTDEVLVLDMKSPEGRAALEQAGPYVLLTESLISIDSRGSMVQTMRAATDSAASRGCDLLLTGPMEADSVQTGRVGSSQPDGNYNSPVRVQKFMLVRMARLQ